MQVYLLAFTLSIQKKSPKARDNMLWHQCHLEIYEGSNVHWQCINDGMLGWKCNKQLNKPNYSMQQLKYLGACPRPYMSLFYVFKVGCTNYWWRNYFLQHCHRRHFSVTVDNFDKRFKSASFLVHAFLLHNIIWHIKILTATMIENTRHLDSSSNRKESVTYG